MPSARRAPPRTLQEFEKEFPDVYRHYQTLRDACDKAGPLPAKTRELIKIAIEVARKRHGGLIAHIDRARAAGASSGDVLHAMLLAIPLIGLPEVLNAWATARKRL